MYLFIISVFRIFQGTAEEQAVLVLIFVLL